MKTWSHLAPQLDSKMEGGWVRVAHVCKRKPVDKSTVRNSGIPELNHGNVVLHISVER